ncbi:unnamed protein product [marine sediment metagenome]|uniref:Uncharacterized protein n=1 Tax=marine sediment metagenome TaxID=412755 RepID=X0YB18_9ZZZZ
MGAVFYDTIQVVKGNARDAYNEACEEANDENGHQQGYSGDIQTADGYSEAKGNPRYGTKAWSKWLDKKDETMYKGDCEYVELTGAVAKRIKGRRWKGRKGIRVFYFFGVGRD